MEITIHSFKEKNTGKVVVVPRLELTGQQDFIFSKSTDMYAVQAGIDMIVKALESAYVDPDTLSQ